VTEAQLCADAFFCAYIIFSAQFLLQMANSALHALMLIENICQHLSMTSSANVLTEMFCCAGRYVNGT